MFKIISLIFICLMCCGCGGDDIDSEDDVKSIVVSPEELTFSYEASGQSITVTANTSWALSSSADWCTVSKSNGYSGNTSVTVSTTQNDSYYDRTATLTFSSVTYKTQFTVTQSFLVQAVPITDQSFLEYCVENFDTDGDGIFSLGEAAKLTTLNISNLNINSVEGIESFVSLEELDISDNNIQAIDLSSLKNLSSLDCSSNDLSELDIQQNINLKALNCTGNPSLAFVYVWTGFSASSEFYKPEGATYVEPEIPTPAGYSLVWQDEFNDARLADGKSALPNTNLWWYETGDGGWGNNEIQNYIAGVSGTDTCAMIYDGSLKIVAKKVDDEVFSIRMNTSDSWTYGYFEARLKLPVGKGTWPAFWMLPKNFTTWPDDGEIDIMEEVGARPNWVASSIHCAAYNHAAGTQKTAEKYISTAESEFHVYAVEWTEDAIKGFIDGDVYFTFNNDHSGDTDKWPFNKPFYLKLNLAWGGDWGGYLGIDESALPTTYEVDYVRVFQKN